MIRHPKAYHRLTYHDWHHSWNEKYKIPTFIFFGIPNFGIGIPISRFFNSGIWLKFFRPKSLESETDPELRFRWGSQKSEPKIGIPNLAMPLRPHILQLTTSPALWMQTFNSSHIQTSPNVMQIGMHATHAVLMSPNPTQAWLARCTCAGLHMTWTSLVKMPSNTSTWAPVQHQKHVQEQATINHVTGRGGE